MEAKKPQSAIPSKVATSGAVFEYLASCPVQELEGFLGLINARLMSAGINPPAHYYAAGSRRGGQFRGANSGRGRGRGRGAPKKESAKKPPTSHMENHGSLTQPKEVADKLSAYSKKKAEILSSLGEEEKKVFKPSSSPELAPLYKEYDEARKKWLATKQPASDSKSAVKTADGKKESKGEPVPPAEDGKGPKEAPQAPAAGQPPIKEEASASEKEKPKEGSPAASPPHSPSASTPNKGKKKKGKKGEDKANKDNPKEG